MFLAVDIGNTHTVLAVWHNASWIHTYRISSSLREETFRLRLLEWCAQHRLTLSLVGIGVSSVVPRLTETVTATLQETFGVQPLRISPALDLGITLRYDNPEALGKDRICSSVAAYTKYRGSLIVVDFGTATTYDCITSDGTFVGGTIAPGIETLMLCLAQRTAQLPEVPLELPPNALNTNTVRSIQAGVLYGVVDALERMIQRLTHELQQFDSTTPTVIATGGFCEWVAQRTSVLHHVEPLLVLEGIYIIWKRTTQR